MAKLTKQPPKCPRGCKGNMVYPNEGYWDCAECGEVMYDRDLGALPKVSTHSSILPTLSHPRGTRAVAREAR